MSAISYKCPNCGGDLQFDPATQQYKCEYCVSHFTQKELEEANPQAEEPQGSEVKEEAGQKTEDGAVLYNCPSCGAEVVTDETTAATFCYYCHNPVVLKGRLEGAYLPNRIIPFKITEQQARERFMQDLKKKKFVPAYFFDKKQIEKITGVYFPYWMCDEHLNGEMSGTATNVRIWRAGQTEYTETRFFDIRRAGDITLSQMNKNALKEANKKLIEGVQPFPMESSTDFTMGYLSGFQAQKRDIEKADLEAEVHKEAEDYAKKLMRDTISGYTTVNVKAAHFQINKEKWDYTLLPVWTLTYKGKDGKIYYYAMNGVTGKVYGELPLSYSKLMVLFAAVMVPVLIICLIGGYLI